MPGQPQKPTPILSYRVGKYQNRSGKLFDSPLFTLTGGGIGSEPKPGFIEHKYTKHSSSSLMEGSNKPDDVITKLASNDREVEGLATNKVLSFSPDNPYYTTGTTDLYKPTKTNISEEGRRRFDEGDISGLPNENTITNHYYSNILKQKVTNLDDGDRKYIQEERIGKGNPGSFFEGKNQNNYTVTASLSDRIDKINALDIHDATDNFDSVLYRDLVRFRWFI